MECKNCKFFKTAEELPHGMGYCRSKPPTVFLVMSQQQVGLHQTVQKGYSSQFAPVKADWWCGDYEDKETVDVKNS